MKTVLLAGLCLLSPVLLADANQHIDIENAFARAAIQQQRNSAAFMTIHNRGQERALVAASSAVAAVVELHTHVNDDGVMRMRKIARIALPAASTVVLQPGGLHVMLLGLKRDLIEGERVPVMLHFADGSDMQLDVPVRRLSMHSMHGRERRGDGQPMMMRH